MATETGVICENCNEFMLEPGTIVYYCNKCDRAICPKCNTHGNKCPIDVSDAPAYATREHASEESVSERINREHAEQATAGMHPKSELHTGVTVTLAEPGPAIVCVESPCAGDTHLHKIYLRACFQDCFDRGEYPFASHALYAFSDMLEESLHRPQDRKLGIEAGFAIAAAACAYRVFYTDIYHSNGMMAAAQRTDLEWERRTISPEALILVYVEAIRTCDCPYKQRGWQEETCVRCQEWTTALMRLFRPSHE